VKIERGAGEIRLLPPSELRLLAQLQQICDEAGRGRPVD
jgi:hypothetical protein